MTDVNSYYLENKHKQLLRIVNFYEKQIDVLDKMLEEVSERYKTSTSESEKEHFHKAFIEKQNFINDLKHNININNYLLTKELTQKNGIVSEVLVNENKVIENDVVKFENEVNELSKDFKMYIMNRI